jgi:hypothetical protein
MLSSLAVVTIVWFSERGASKYFSHKMLMCGLIKELKQKRETGLLLCLIFLAIATSLAPDPIRRTLLMIF